MDGIAVTPLKVVRYDVKISNLQLNLQQRLDVCVLLLEKKPLHFRILPSPKTKNGSFTMMWSTQGLGAKIPKADSNGKMLLRASGGMLKL